MTDEKPDATFSEADDYHATWDDGYHAGVDAGRQEKIDLTVAGAILIALIAGALGMVVGIAITAN